VSKKSRDRHLAKQAARRQAEKRRKRRQRNMALGIGLGVGAAVVAFAVVALLRGGGGKEAAASASPTATVSTSPTPSVASDQVKPSPGPKAVACGAKAPKDATTPKPQFTHKPNMKVDVRNTYLATLKTSCGTIVVQLETADAPQTVNSFVFLAKRGYFDGTRFHRLDTSLDIIQAGDPTGTGSGGPGYTLPDELTGKEVYRAGVVAMANTGAPDTGGSQFFIVTGKKALQSLGQSYTIFGRIVEGLGVARRIQNLPIKNPDTGYTGQQPKQSVYIDTVKITVK
jgi:cyclophilin family peptidyl-prolyl cis-trans isomerase